MKTLLYYKKQRLEEFLYQLTVLNQYYIERRYELEDELVLFLEKLEHFFQELGESNYQAKVSHLLVYYHTAKRGINPQTLEKLKLGKRENSWIGIFHVLESVTEILTDDYEQLNEKLEEASALLNPLILSAIQSKLITEKQLEALEKRENLESLWIELLAHEQVMLIEKKLKLSMEKEDIFILLDMAFSKINAH